MIAQPDASLFQCPDCKSRLDNLDGCARCGRCFEQDNGTPVIMPTVRQNVEVSVEPAAFDPANIPKDEFFRYPPRSGQLRTGAYHLDKAHDEVLSGLRDQSIVLETGCGGAQMRTWATSRRLRYLGVDISKTRVHDWLQEHGGPDVLCDAHSLPFRDGTFDAVYAVATWEHLAYPQLAAMEAARVLKPGGMLLGSMSFLEPWHDSSYFHMTPFGVHMCLRLAGVKPLFIWPEAEWPGFKAILAMGNKATRPLGVLGRAMNYYYLAPKAAQFALRHRRMPTKNDLIDSIASVAGAVAWIAVKPDLSNVAREQGQ
jgi:SAM-dependent methyltransferase